MVKNLRYIKADCVSRHLSGLPRYARNDMVEVKNLNSAQNIGELRVEALDYSVRNATTGSFLAAEREGIIPENRVRPTLIKTSITATGMGR